MIKKIASMLMVLAFIAMAGCSSQAQTSSLVSSTISTAVNEEGTGGDNAEWCKHTEEERQWIHKISGTFTVYIGTFETDPYIADYEAKKYEMSDEEFEAWTVMAFFKYFKLSPEEVAALLDHDKYDPSVKSRILKEVFGSDTVTNSLPRVDVDYVGNVSYTFGTENVSYPQAAGGTEENTIPYELFTRVGIKHYYEWFNTLKDKKAEFTATNFIKYFNVPVETFDEAMKSIARYCPDSIYTQAVMDKIRTEVYGSAKEYQWKTASIITSSGVSYQVTSEYVKPQDTVQSNP